MTVVRRAPGKLFVAGEYAVVEPGNQAILVAVDRYVTVTVSEPGEAGVVISSDLAPRPVHRQWRDGRLAASDEGGERAGLTHVLSAIETVGRLLAERGRPAPALSVSVSSELHDNGTKFGLGSSGAVTVATVAAVAAFCGLELSPDARYRLAVLATAETDVKASGGDLAAGTWGGWIAYRAPDRAAVLDLARRRGVEEALGAPWPGFEVRRLPPPDGLSLEVGWTGTPASTTSLVSGLHRRTWRGSASHQRFMETSADFVRAAVSAFERGDQHDLMHQIRRARRELARLDDEVGLGIFTTELTALCDAAEAVGGAAKPSGAGGGDCGIALLDAEASQDITHVRERWAMAGVRPLPIRPALEGNEE
ncbi:phosphomevalonate kinase [Streptomyces sp. AV19]|uniref:phosphomevalonate kinase n=1 Tax=Streptomyces sp. AV19 TaxID=2793068 RepID=UPI0018FE04C3|nr:phosphomevalonate kinase [Streptomyces sp. AV19]MBH1938536.1 phosphomevalonate kinase [Streptomyces sp. AV19]MDG4535185.1 phosphomevalonate kinase [Streptomyces sp. AV19]